MTETLTLSFVLSCSPDRAFTLWTERIDTWWPSDHTVTGRNDLTVVLEPGVGGRIFERTPDGSEHDWGEVTVWDPPNRLSYRWHLARDLADATEVTIRFVASGDDRTDIQIVHTGWERLGAEADEWRERNQWGWQGLMPHFLDLASRPTTETDEVSSP